MNWSFVLVVIALVAFGLAAIGVDLTKGKVSYVPLGLFCWLLATQI